MLLRLMLKSWDPNVFFLLMLVIRCYASSSRCLVCSIAINVVVNWCRFEEFAELKHKRKK